MMSKSEKLNVIGCYLLVLVGVAFMISNLVWKIIVVAVLAILGGVVFYLLLKPDKPKKTGGIDDAAAYRPIFAWRGI